MGSKAHALRRDLDARILALTEGFGEVALAAPVPGATLGTLGCGGVAFEDSVVAH